MNAERLLKLVEFLENLPPENFDFKEIISSYTFSTLTDAPCASVACALGWLPAVFPDELEWSAGASDIAVFVRRKGTVDQDSFYTAERFLDISSAEADYFFVGRMKHPTTGKVSTLSSESTAQEVAAHIRAYVEDYRKAFIKKMTETRLDNSTIK